MDGEPMDERGELFAEAVAAMLKVLDLCAESGIDADDVIEYAKDVWVEALR